MTRYVLFLHLWNVLTIERSFEQEAKNIVQINPLLLNFIWHTKTYTVLKNNKTNTLVWLMFLLLSGLNLLSIIDIGQTLKQIVIRNPVVDLDMFQFMMLFIVVKKCMYVCMFEECMCECSSSSICPPSVLAFPTNRSLLLCCSQGPFYTSNVYV